MTAGDLRALVDRVAADPELLERFLPIREQAAFRAAVVALAAQLGLAVSDSDVEDGLRAAREWWLMRWV